MVDSLDTFPVVIPWEMGIDSLVTFPVVILSQQSFGHTMVETPDVHPNSAVKPHWVCLVLRWGTTRELHILE